MKSWSLRLRAGVGAVAPAAERWLIRVIVPVASKQVKLHEAQAEITEDSPVYSFGQGNGLLSLRVTGFHLLYLSGGKFPVSGKKKVPDKKSIANGIPQEWILGLLLFKMCVFLFVSFIKHMMKHGGSDSFCKHPQLCNWSNLPLLFDEGISDYLRMLA